MCKTNEPTEIRGLPALPDGMRWIIKNTSINAKKLHLQERRSFLGFSWWRSVGSNWIHENLPTSDWRLEVLWAANNCLREYEAPRECPVGVVVPEGDTE